MLELGGDAIVPTQRPRLRDDASVVPTVGEQEGHVRFHEQIEFVHRPPWRDMIGLGPHREHGKTDITLVERHTRPQNQVCSQAEQETRVLRRGLGHHWSG